MRSVKVKVTPGASKELLREMGNESFEVFVPACAVHADRREPAQRNMANKRVCEIIAAHFGAPQNAALIEKGQRSRNKIICIKI